MSDNTVNVQLTRIDGRLNLLEVQMERLLEQNELITDLRVELGKLQTQIKVTWVLMLLVISSLVGVAFSMW